MTLQPLKLIQISLIFLLQLTFLLQGTWYPSCPFCYVSITISGNVANSLHHTFCINWNRKVLLHGVFGAFFQRCTISKTTRQGNEILYAYGGARTKL